MRRKSFYGFTLTAKHNQTLNQYAREVYQANKSLIDDYYDVKDDKALLGRTAEQAFVDYAKLYRKVKGLSVKATIKTLITRVYANRVVSHVSSLIGSMEINFPLVYEQFMSWIKAHGDDEIVDYSIGYVGDNVWSYTCKDGTTIMIDAKNSPFTLRLVG